MNAKSPNVQLHETGLRFRAIVRKANFNKGDFKSHLRKKHIVLYFIFTHSCVKVYFEMCRNENFNSLITTKL